MTDTALEDAALNIGRDLCATAAAGTDGCTWESMVVAGTEGGRPVFVRGDVGTSLYDGTAGIAWSLAACAIASGDEHMAQVAVAATRHALAGAEAMVESAKWGLFDGATGVAWSAAVVGRALAEPALCDAAAGLIADIAVSVAREPTRMDEVDLIGGLSGALLGLLGCAATLSSALPDLTAARAALARAAIPQVWGAAWPTGAAAPGGPPLVGFGHGAAGIALALGEPAAADDAVAAVACAEALEYERSWFDPTVPGWPDLRDGAPREGATALMNAWCHGATGIGLSRLRLATVLDDARLGGEAAAALQAARNLVVGAGNALRRGTLSDCTSCHGLAGAAELMLTAARSLDDTGHANAARRVARLMVEQRAASEDGWPCGLPGAGEVPALMTGTAGIALTLLRAAGAVDLPTPLLPGPSGW